MIEENRLGGICRKSYELEVEKDFRGRILPKMGLVDHTLTIDRYLIPLGRKKTVRILIEAFFKKAHQPLSTNNLANLIYGCSDLAIRSARYKKSMQGRITRLVSRARALLSEEVPKIDGETWIEFFHYRPSQDDYEFFSLTNKYLASLEKKYRQ